MSAIKFSQLKTLTNPSGETIFPVVFNGTNWKVSLDAIKGTIVTNWADVQNKPTFHETAFSGDYTRLTNLPSIPTNNNQLSNGSGFITTSSLTWNNITGKPNLFSGAYADLTGKPTLFSGSYNDLTDKPQLFNGDYNNLTNTPAIPTNTNQLTNGAGFITTSSITWEALQSSVPLATVAKTGSYTDLGNKPNIPADISDLTDTQGLLGVGTANTGSVTKSIQTVTTSTPTSITADVVFGDPNAAGGAVNLVLPASPGNGDVVTVKNINAGGNSVYVQTDGILNMETETGTIGSGVYATISTSGAFITWIYESSSTTWRIIG